MSSAEQATRRLGQRMGRLTFEAGYLGGFYVVFTALAFLFPRSGDDWAWGSSIGTDRLHVLFRDSNGRYSGNFLILFLTRAQTLLPFIEAGVVTLTLWLVLDFIGSRTSIGYAVAIVLFLGQPLGDWRQAIVWASGFANYATSALGVFVFLRAAKLDWLGRLQRKWLPVRLIGTLVAGFVFAMFMENVTLYLLAASVVYAIVRWVRFKSVSLDSLAWIVSLVAGAAVMFSNPAYRNARYQQVNSGGLKTHVTKLLDLISNLAVGQNVVLNVALALVICLVAGANIERIGRLKAAITIGSAVAFLALSSAVQVAEQNVKVRLMWRCLEGVAAGFLLLALVLTAYVVLADVAKRVQISVAVASIVVLVAPLIVVSPIGPRLFYVTYLLFVLIVIVLVDDLVGAVAPKITRRVVPALGAIAAAMLASYFTVYAVIHHDSEQRLAYVRAQVAKGATNVTVKALPFRGYVHVPDPTGPVWSYRYKLVYHLPADLTIKVKRAR